MILLYVYVQTYVTAELKLVLIKRIDISSFYLKILLLKTRVNYNVGGICTKRKTTTKSCPDPESKLCMLLSDLALQ